MNKLIYTLLSLFAAQVATAQCGTDRYNQELVNEEIGRTDVSYFDKIEGERNFDYQITSDLKTKKATRIIPVVFHVIHSYGSENISKAQIEDQIRIINEDFQHRNADASKTRNQFRARAADFDIEFKLARKAPDGSCTEGITRTYDPINMVDDRDSRAEEAKGAVPPWDRSKYLNIWVVKEILSSSEGTILGYAQFPGRGASTDGIVMIHNRVGTIGTANVGDKGRTLTHEIGHWLGLYHTFQGGCFQGDGVSDTPPVDEPSYGCTASQNPNTCSNDSEVDMVENYMDYADGGCMNAFTNGQLARVDGFLNSSSNRGTNISAATLFATGVNTTPSCGPVADFWYASERLTICEGQSIDFLGLSYNGTVTSRTWSFEGGTPATSSAQNPTIVYNKQGIYKVELEVGNNEGTDKLSRTLFINVTPGVAILKAPGGQDFENASTTSKWQLEKQEGKGWLINSSTGFSGNRCLQALIDEETAAGFRVMAISEPVDIANYEEQLSLHFKYAYARRIPASTERLLVLGSNTCGASWDILKVYLNANLETSSVSPDWAPSSAADWGRSEIDISRYAGSQNLYIRFDAVGQQGNSIFLDDINIGSSALSVKNQKTDINLFLVPNPAQDQVAIRSAHLKGKISVSIVDIAGRLLLQQNLEPNRFMINTSELTNGMYTAIIESDNISWSKKLIISK
jgi:PKD repeat protein